MITTIIIINVKHFIHENLPCEYTEILKLNKNKATTSIVSNIHDGRKNSKVQVKASFVLKCGIKCQFMFAIMGFILYLLSI